MVERLLKTEHQGVQKDLSAYLDGELDARERARVERHLQVCAECRADLESLRQTVKLLHLVPEVRLPRSFLIPVSESRTVARRAPAFGILRTASAVVTLLFVAVLSSNVWLRLGGSLAPLALLQPAAESERATYEEAAPLAEAPSREGEIAVREMPVVETEVVEKEVEREVAVVQEVQVAESSPVAAWKVDAVGEATAVLPTPPAPLLASQSREMPMTPALEKEAAEIRKEEPVKGLPVPGARGTSEPALMEKVAPIPTDSPTPQAPARTREEATVVAEAQPVAPTKEYGLAAEGTADSRQRLSVVLNSVMWALLVSTIVLWAATTILHKQRRR